MHRLEGLRHFTVTIVHPLEFMADNLKPRVGGVILSDARRFDARKEVTLAAGTLRIPHILRLTGIGPRNYLTMLSLQ